MAKTFSLSDELFSFVIPNEEEAKIKGRIIKADYEEIDKANAKLRALCEEYVYNDVKAEAIAAYSWVGN